ncbi:MAG TPA: exodeoxyribonuclease V subunit gamma [Polyangia bacterium]|nr:exodeoxyribonuclease V subunit gamma [Polyangia bacterium]
MIRLVYSNRTEELLRALAGDLARARGAGQGLFERVPLVVPNPQIETYVKLGVARDNGIAAHIETTYLRGHLAAVVAASAPDVALVDRATLEGELLSLFHDERRLGAGALGPVRAYLGAGGDGADARDLRRAQLAAELATLFDEYAFARPELLRAWRDGRTIQGAGAPDDDKRATEAWQRALWLALHGRGGAFEARGRADGKRYLDLPGFFAGVGPRDLDTPRVTYVFGISYVARLYREVFAALGRAGDVFIYALNPCREFWEDLDNRRASRARAGERARFPRRRAAEQLSLLPATEAAPVVDDPPALVLWARPGRENIALLNDLAECDFVPRFADPLAEPVTVLAQLQQDILDRVPARGGAARLELADDSITVRPCPDPRRELETIAAEIWKLVPRGLRFTDVAVVVPPSAADTYLPLAAAVLREASDLPHTIIDAPAVRGSRVLEAVGLLLALPTGPLGRQDLLRLVMHPSVAGRFPDADPRDWLALAEELDIVHGADRGDHAGTYVEGDRFNWDQGLRRLALGAFLAGRRSGDERAFEAGGERYLPEELPPEGQASAQAFGLLARALIGFATRARDVTQTIAAWMADLRREIAATLVAREPEDEVALARVFAELQRLESVAPADLRVRYRIAHELVRAALAALPARGGRYLTQGVTVSTFLPMRAVPFAAVFMVGMGEGLFPAPERARELDLRGRDHRVPGDVSVREQDQYMFLETLLCARARVTISYVDRDAVSGEARGPSSTVLELLDMLEAGYLRGGDASLVKRAAPPLRRHEDDATCAVVPAAARERRAARLGRAMQAAAGGRVLPEWLGLRTALAPEALAALGPALAWTAPREAARAASSRATRVLSFRQLLRFMQCPLQGSALALLPMGDADAEAEAAAAFREHEDFDLAWPRALAPLRDALARACGADGAREDSALARAYDEATTSAALDGTLPHGLFGVATRALHIDCLRGWRATLDELGGLDDAPARVFVGHGPEHRAGVVIRPAPRLETALPVGDGPARLVVELHGETNLLATLDGAPALLLASSSSTPGNGNGRDRLTAFIDQLALAATDPAGAPRRRGVVLRPGQAKPETFWLRAITRAEACDFLARLATELLGAVHPYFFPCEAVLGWRKKKEPRPELTTYVHTLRDSDWKTHFTSDWGPVPHASAYPLPSDEEAMRLLEARFGLYFATIEEDASPPPGAAAKATPAPRRGAPT